MDIFTTQLARVVQVPIKPANLKVKALLKNAATGELKEDLDHLESHENYFVKQGSDLDSDEKSDTQQDDEPKDNQGDSEDKKPADSVVVINKLLAQKEKVDNDDDNGITVSEDGVKHLDIYI